MLYFKSSRKEKFLPITSEEIALATKKVLSESLGYFKELLYE